MKFTRYIVVRHNGCDTDVYTGGRWGCQFQPLELPNKLGKLFDRKGLALKKAKELNDELEAPDYDDLYYSVSRVKIEIEGNVELEGQTIQ